MYADATRLLKKVVREAAKIKKILAAAAKDDYKKLDKHEVAGHLLIAEAMSDDFDNVKRYISNMARTEKGMAPS